MSKNADDSAQDVAAELEATIAKMSKRISENKADNKKDVVALITRGEAYFDLGEDDKAEADLAAALKADADSASTHFSWARMQLVRGEIDDALEHIQRSIEIDSSKPGQATDKALAYDDASRAMAQAILAEVLIAKDRSADAYKAVDRAIALDPKNAEYYALRSELAQDVGDLDKALADLDKAITLDPNSYELLRDRAELHLVRGDEKAASADLAKAFEVAEATGTDDESLAELYAARGEVYVNSGDDLRAREDLKRALELDPENQDALLGLAELSIRARDFDLANKYLDKANQIDDEDPMVAYFQGVLERAREKPKAALKAFDRCLELVPDYAEALYLRGQVKKDLGQNGDDDLARATELGFEGP